MASLKRSGGRPSVAESKRIYENILKAAMQLFIARGYGATSAEDIATQAGVSKPTLYRHFPNKAEIFNAMIRTQIDENDESWLSPEMSDSIEKDLMLAGYRMVHYSSWPMSEIVRLIHAEAPRFPELAEIISRMRGIARAYIAHVLRHHGCREDNADHFADLFISLVLENPVRHSLLYPMKAVHPDELANHLKKCVHLFLHGWQEGIC